MRTPGPPHRDTRDGLTRAVDSLKFRHVVLFALAFSIYNSMRTPENVSVNELNRGAGLDAHRRHADDGVAPRGQAGGGGFLGAGAGAGAGSSASRGRGGGGRGSRKGSGDLALPPRAPSEKDGHARFNDADGVEAGDDADDEDDEDEVTPARPQADEKPGSARPQLGCRVVLPPRAHWTVRASELSDATPARDRCRWGCVAAYRKVRVGDKDRCIPCNDAILPPMARWVTDAAGSSCGWRCRPGHERLNDRGCSPCVGGLPANAEWRRVDGECAWRCKTGYAGGSSARETAAEEKNTAVSGVGDAAGGGGGVASSGAALALLGRSKRLSVSGSGGGRCVKCVTRCDPGSFMVGEGDGRCPAGTQRDARRCERCPRDLPAFTTWTRGCKFRCGNGFYRSPLGCATCARTCAPGRLLAGVCDPYAMRDGSFCTSCPPEPHPLPAGASYVSHCTHACPPGKCRHAATNACVPLITPCGPGFKLRGLVAEEGACPGDAAAAAATLLRRWSASVGNDAGNEIERALAALPARATSARQLTPIARFTSSLCEPCGSFTGAAPGVTTAMGGGPMPKGAVWRDGCTWHCPRDFYLHTEFDVTANASRSFPGAGSASGTGDAANAGGGAAAPVVQSCLPCTKTCPQGEAARLVYTHPPPTASALPSEVQPVPVTFFFIWFLL